jgi:hypothetical protein
VAIGLGIGLGLGGGDGLAIGLGVGFGGLTSTNALAVVANRIIAADAAKASTVTATTRTIGPTDSRSLLAQRE